MISRNRIKRWVAEGMLIVGGLLALTLVVAAARLVLVSSTGADSASAYHEVAAVPPDAADLVTWDQDAWTRDRQLEPATRTELESAYIRAWAAMGRLESTGDDSALANTFSGPARAAARAMPRNLGVATWDLGHRLTLDFYALDGATVAFHDADASFVRTIGSGPTETVLLSHETYDVVMVLEDGYWRVRQLRRGPDPTLTTVTAPALGQATVTGTAAVNPRAVTADVATEYRPAAWTPAGIAAAPQDFRRATDIGITAVRIPLPITVFGSASPNTVALAAFKQVLADADAAGLRVQLVLFDGLTSVAPGQWASADTQAKAVLAAAATSRAVDLLVIGTDLDLAKAAGPAEIDAFVWHEAQVLHGLSANLPVTAGWHAPAAAADRALATQLDAVTVDADPDPIALTPAVLTGLPVLVVAAGPATDGGWGPKPRTDTAQAAALAAELRAAHTINARAVSVAALRDAVTLPAPTVSTTGSSAELSAASASASSAAAVAVANSGGSVGQRGLFRSDGSVKPAAALLRPGADLDVPGQGVLDILTGRFYKVLAFLVVAVTGGVWWTRRTRRRAGAHLGSAAED